VCRAPRCPVAILRPVRGQLAAVLVFVLALAGAGCGGSAKINPARDSAKTGDVAHGAFLFMNGTDGQVSCAFCHPMKAAGAHGPFGPSLDQEGREYQSVHLSDREIRKLVLDFLVNGRCGTDTTDPSHCMPKNLVTGQDAIDVASYIAQCSGKAGHPGCRPDDSAAGGNAVALSGLRLYRSLRCVSCHSLSENVAFGPSFKGLAGSEVKLTNGKTVTADDAYLTESIIAPDDQIVDGFSAGVMSRTLSPGTVSPAQAKAIIAFIKRVH
jgi:mono/diheme cytochrome c family protein